MSRRLCPFKVMARGSSARDVVQYHTQTLASHHGNTWAPFVLSHQGHNSVGFRSQICHVFGIKTIVDAAPALCCCFCCCWDRGSKHSWRVRGQILHFLSLGTMWLEEPKGEAGGHEWEGRCLDFLVLCVSLSFSLLHPSCPSFLNKKVF